jgi:hypothetical protein
MVYNVIVLLRQHRRVECTASPSCKRNDEKKQNSK